MADPDKINADAQVADQLIVRATQPRDLGDDILRVITSARPKSPA